MVCTVFVIISATFMHVPPSQFLSANLKHVVHEGYEVPWEQPLEPL
jgi:hypothetical protein